MTLLIDIHSVEFYVMLFTIAALCVGILAVPSGRGRAETGFLTGKLDFDPDPTPRVEFRCHDDGSVEMRRTGLPSGLDNAATVALAVTRTGFDISIEERVTPGTAASAGLLESELMAVNRATFVIPGLAQERYHIKYNSDATSAFVALTLSNRPGLTAVRNFPV